MLSNHDLLEGLDSVTTIPLIPFRGGEIDHRAHQKNIDYLMVNNHLSDNRPRVICLAGTSLIHQVDHQQQNALLQTTSEVMGEDGILLSALVPQPIHRAGELVEHQSRMKRPPDAYLIMPLGGVYSPQGLYETFLDFGNRYGKDYGARFLYYYRRPRDLPFIIRLIKDCPHFIGVKVGTSVSDVAPLIRELRDDGMVIWGIGDRSTAAAEQGSKGHTSGISVIVARAGDLINNAQRQGDFQAAYEIEKRIAPLEELRFQNEREYNYTAVLEAMLLSGFADIDGGEGGPFNPRVPSDISKKIQEIMDDIADLH